MSSRQRSLRVRLALIGVVGVFVPLAVLLTVSVLSTEETRTSSTGRGDLVERTRALSPWVPLTTAALAAPTVMAAWWWAGRAVDPLRRIAMVADEIQSTSLDRRIGLVDAPDEVQRLADSFDQMLDRLAESSNVQRRLLEDTSHQLRTPLAVLATTADVALADADADVDDLRTAMWSTRDTVDRLRAIIDDLLATARAVHHASARAGNDLVAIAADARATYADAARARGVEIALAGADQLFAACDGAPVARAVGSLVDNAVRHAPLGSVVEIMVEGTADQATVSVVDRGPGIPAAERDRIFERYWSSDPEAGLGIGLAIVQQVAEAHEGVEVTSPLGPEGGTRFTLRFRPG